MKIINHFLSVFLLCLLVAFGSGTALAFEHDLSGRPTKGAKDAPIEIVEFSDYQCGHCRKLQPILHEVLGEYGDLISITVVTLDIVGPYSGMIAEFAMTVWDKAPDKFWEVHYQLYLDQNKVDQAYLFNYAKKLGLDPTLVAENIKNNTHRPLRKKNFYLAVDDLELEYTPTLFINGQKLQGCKQADTYRYYINQALKAKNVPSPVADVAKPTEEAAPKTLPGRVPPDMIFPVPVEKPQDSKLKVKVGQKAPDFTLPKLGPPGATLSLSEYLGKKNVVLSFVPAAWTPACSAQWPEYNDNKAKFDELNTVIIGISVDNIPTLYSWSLTMGILWFPVASDFFPHGKVAQTYGLLRTSGVSERAVIVIDKKGIIRYIDVHDINTRPDINVLLDELKKIQ